MCLFSLLRVRYFFFSQILFRIFYSTVCPNKRYNIQRSHCFHILGKPGNKEDCTPVFILIKSFSRAVLIMLFPTKVQLTQHLGDLERIYKVLFSKPIDNGILQILNFEIK